MNFNPTETTQQIATYHLQGNYSHTKVFDDQVNAPHARELTLDDTSHSIKSFLQRPIDIANLKWSTTNEANSELIPNGIRFPDVFLQNKAYRDKINKFVGVRGKLMIRVKMNPQPYQQGTLLAYYIPNVKTISEKVKMIRASLSGKTGCPCNIDMDAQDATMFDIEVPYVSEFNFYNLLTGQGTYGAFYLASYLPLKSKKQNDFVNITIQAYWIDPQPMFATGVELFVPTESEQQQLHDNTLEMGGSSHITKDSLITTLLTDEIKPSTVLKTGANLLQLAGYQKPNIETGICQSHLQTAKFMGNYNGEQFSHSMGLSSTNKLEHPPMPASTGEDEMNLNSIMSKSNYYKTFTWKTDNIKGDVLWHDEVYPCKLAPSETTNVYNSTFVAFASSPFTMWKGSMVYYFKLAKTIYHSGSIRVSWCPGLYDEDFNGNSITNPDFDINMNYSEVYDIKETKEFNFIVPYTAVTPALHNINPYSTQAKTIPKREWCGGSIVVEVFTDLVVNETIAVGEIDTAVRVSGGSDLEMIGASAPSFFPYTPSSVRTEGVTENDGGFRSEEDKKVLQPITGALKNSFLTSALLSGECVTSIKNFLGRMALYGSLTGTATSSVIKICPFDFQGPLNDTSSNIKNFDFLDYFSYLYGWYAGGVNVSLYNLSATAARYYEARLLPGLNSYYPSDFTRVSYLTTTDATKYDATLARLPLPTQVVKPDLEGMVHLMVPYYNRVQITPTLTKEQTQNLTEQGAYPAPILYVKSSNSVSDYRVYRSATDSFQFYYLLGPPQVVLLSGSATLTPFIYPDVLIDTQKQVVVDEGSSTVKVSPFFQSSSVDFVLNTPVPFNPNAFFLSLYRTNSGDPNNLMIVPGGDTYSFTRGSGGDILISQTGITFNAWYLLTGKLQSTIPPNTGTYDVWHVMTPVSTNTSEPIKRSYVNKSSLIFNSDNSTIRMANYNAGNIVNTGETYSITSDMLFLLYDSTTSAMRPIILVNGTKLTFRRVSAVNVVFEDESGRRYLLISTLGTQVKYDGTLSTVSSYLTNIPT